MEFVSSAFILGFLLIFLGLWGIVVVRKNLIVTLMAIELILLGVNYIFITGSIAHDDLLGQIVSVFVLTVAAAESAIGLGLLVVFYRLRALVSLDGISLLKG